jgi:hypothetical protein
VVKQQGAAFWSMYIGFLGMGGLVGLLETLKGEMNEAVAEELDSVWQQIKEMAIELCPKDTGALASSIKLGSEGGQGVVLAGNEFYGDTISAGEDNIVNPKSGAPTSSYAIAVHDGHLLRNGQFWEGTPFLEDALDAFASELELAVNRAMQKLDEEADKQSQREGD